MNKCSICFKSNREFITSSCNHHICTGCLYKEIFFNYEDFMRTQSDHLEINLKCIICSIGSFKLNRKQVYEKIKSHQNLKEEEPNCSQCTEDTQKILILYCNDCQNFFCASCLTTHPSNHNFTNNSEIKINNNCSIHLGKQLKSECKTCSIPICLICEEINHEGHLMIDVKKAYKDKRQKLYSKLPFPSFQEFNDSLDFKKEKVIKGLRKKSEDFIRDINNLISNLSDTIDFFNNKVSQIEGNFETSVENVKSLFKNFYDDLINISEEDYRNLNFLSKLTDKFKVDFFDYTDLKYKEINSFLNQDVKSLREKINEIKEISFINLTTHDYSKSSWFYKFEKYVENLIELNNHQILTTIGNKIRIFKLNDNNLELVETHEVGSRKIVSIIQLENDKFAYYSNYHIFICDSKFKVLNKLPAKFVVSKICKLSRNSFAVGYTTEIIEIYSKDNFSEDYSLNLTYTSFSVNSLLYIPKNNFLLAGSEKGLIKVWNLNYENFEKANKLLTGHFNTVSSLIYVNDDIFISSCSHYIRIWSINDFACIKSISSNLNHFTNLISLGEKYFLTVLIDKSLFSFNSSRYNTRAPLEYLEVLNEISILKFI
jgi:WD40 repeat protein